MAKAVLVMVMPEVCEECDIIMSVPNSGTVIYFCPKLARMMDPYDKPTDCPLVPMPERWTPETEDYSRCADVEYYVGWNECLDEIDGGSEDG